MRFTHSVVIDVPPAEVFAFLSDPANLPRWQPSVQGVRKNSSGPIAVRSRFTEIRTFLGKRVESTLEVTAYEPPKMFSLKVIAGPVVFHVEHELDSRDGGTELTVSGEAEASGLARFAAPVAVRAAKREAVIDFARLKQVLEQRRADGASEHRASPRR